MRLADLMPTTSMTLFARPLISLAIALSLLLAGCQSTRERVADCKTGDWRTIGHKDGFAGTPPNFAERKEFCEGVESAKGSADAAANYQAGWAQGNWDVWSEMGRSDGRNALQLTQFGVHAGAAEVRKNNTPLNRPAYEAGWAIGISEYWDNIGKRDGTAGKPLTAQEAARSAAAGQGIHFDDAAYATGWQTGNRTFWQDAGFEDARNGIPDSAFKARAATAKGAGVAVQEEMYRSAWSKEIVNYWTNLGAQDAVSGKDFALRRVEAQRKGLKVFETEYRRAWENRLADYWRQMGHDDGYGKPFRLDERMANAAANGVFVIAGTRELYTAAWDAENARYCNPDNAFELGRGSRPMAIDVCRGELQGQMKFAWLSGRDYESIAARQASIASDINDLEYRLRETRKRMRRLDDEIRSNLDNKDRVQNEETAKQDKRRDNERRELIEQANRVERLLMDAHRQDEQYQREMQRLRREIYLSR